MTGENLDFEDATELAPPAPRRGRRQTAPLLTASRTLPASAEAEEHVLSCCLLDGSDTVEKCIARKITGQTFFAPENRAIFEVVTALHGRGRPIDTAVIGEELKRQGQLEEVGGYAYLMKVSAGSPTTAQADYFIEKLRELEARREIIRISTASIEQAYTSTDELPELVAKIEASVAGVVKQTRRQACWVSVPFMDFRIPEENDGNILLGKYRYACRDAIGFIAGPSSVGKSSLCFQWAALAALGRDFLGIPTHGKLTSLIVNGEDDDGDVGEVREGVVAGLKLTDAEVDEVRKRVFMCKVRTETGEDFFRELGRKAAEVGADLVWINPLLAFAGMDITKPGEASRLRASLKAGNPDGRFCYMIVHHTNKPPGAKDKPERNWNEFMYNMTGAADLTNMARFVITIDAKKDNGEFIIRLAKRGKRAGVTKTIAPDGETSGAYKTEIVTEIHARHSTRKIEFGNGRSLPMIFWEPSDNTTVDEKPQRDASRGGGRPASVSFNELRSVIAKLAPDIDHRQGYNALHRVACTVKHVPKGVFNRVIDEAIESGQLVKHGDDGKYYVT